MRQKNQPGAMTGLVLLQAPESGTGHGQDRGWKTHAGVRIVDLDSGRPHAVEVGISSCCQLDDSAFPVLISKIKSW